MAPHPRPRRSIIPNVLPTIKPPATTHLSGASLSPKMPVFRHKLGDMGREVFFNSTSNNTFVNSTLPSLSSSSSIHTDHCLIPMWATCFPRTKHTMGDRLLCLILIALCQCQERIASHCSRITTSSISSSTTSSTPPPAAAVSAVSSSESNSFTAAQQQQQQYQHQNLQQQYQQQQQQQQNLQQQYQHQNLQQQYQQQQQQQQQQPSWLQQQDARQRKRKISVGGVGEGASKSRKFSAFQFPVTLVPLEDFLSANKDEIIEQFRFSAGSFVGNINPEVVVDVPTGTGLSLIGGYFEEVSVAHERGLSWAGDFDKHDMFVTEREPTQCTIMKVPSHPATPDNIDQDHISLMNCLLSWFERMDGQRPPFFDELFQRIHFPASAEDPDGRDKYLFVLRNHPAFARPAKRRGFLEDFYKFYKTLSPEEREKFLQYTNRDLFEFIFHLLVSADNFLLDIFWKRKDLSLEQKRSALEKGMQGEQRLPFTSEDLYVAIYLRHLIVHGPEYSQVGGINVDISLLELDLIGAQHFSWFLPQFMEALLEMVNKYPLSILEVNLLSKWLAKKPLADCDVLEFSTMPLKRKSQLFANSLRNNYDYANVYEHNGFCIGLETAYCQISQADNSSTRRVWTIMKNWISIDFPLPERRSDSLAVWWLEARQHFRTGYRELFDTVFMLTCWFIWKERNGRIFEHRSRTPEQLVHDIKEELMIWKMAGVFAECSNNGNGDS
uniref:Uncharacterized protein n=1 Tax=Oryza glumipatula TaxID=40148 RepID=A0A0D9Z2S0_9ORYZ